MYQSMRFRSLVLTKSYFRFLAVHDIRIPCNLDWSDQNTIEAAIRFQCLTLAVEYICLECQLKNPYVINK